MSLEGGHREGVWVVESPFRSKARSPLRPLEAGFRLRRARRSASETWGWIFLALVLVLWFASLAVGFQNTLIALTVCGFAAAILGLRFPILGVFGIGILCTLDAMTRVLLLTGGLWRWNTFNYWLLVAVCLNIPLLLRWTGIQKRLLIGLTGLLAVGLLYTGSRVDGIQHMLGLVALFGLFVYLRRASGDAGVWPWLGIVNGALAALGGFMFILHHDRITYIDRNAWVFMHLTGLFSISMGIAFVQRRRWLLWSLVSLAAINLGWVFLSASRGAMLIGACCLIVTFIGIRGGNRRLLFLAATAILIALLLSQYADLSRFALGRVQRFVDADTSLARRTSRRSELVAVGWQIFLGNPVIGVGTGGFAPTVESFERYGVELGYVDAHAGWIKTLAENGLPGFLLQIVFVFSFAWLGWRHRRRGLIHLGMLVTLTLSTAFLSTEFQGKGLWLLTAGVMVLLRRAELAHRAGTSRARLVTAPALGETVRGAGIRRGHQQP